MSKTERSGGAGRLLLFLLVIMVLAGGAFIVFTNIMGGPADRSSEEMIVVTVAEGSGTESIGRLLEENGVIKSTFEFKLKSRLDGNDGKYKAGSYELSPSMSMDEIMEIMVSGKQKSIKVTVPEGYTLRQIAETAAASGICTTEEFLAESSTGVFDFKYDDQMAEGELRYEGFLFPDTYLLSENASAHDLIQMMLNRFTEIYDPQAANATMTSCSLMEVITVASLIEREARADEERPLIASVIYNRLDKGMKLQIDATVQYALGEQKDRLLYSDLKVESPYNTYTNEGLPPAPIASPGQASINAALNPAQSDYLFYVLKSADSIEHNFAVTDTEFAVVFQHS